MGGTGIGRTGKGKEKGGIIFTLMHFLIQCAYTQDRTDYT